MQRMNLSVQNAKGPEAAPMQRMNLSVQNAKGPEAAPPPVAPLGQTGRGNPEEIKRRNKEEEKKKKEAQDAERNYNNPPDPEVQRRRNDRNDPGNAPARERDRPKRDADRLKTPTSFAPPPTTATPPPLPPAADPVAKPSVAAAASTSSGATEPLVKKISPQSGKQAMLDEMDKQGITDPVKRAAIMAQAAVETGGFQYLSENLSYSAARMKEVFGRLKGTSIETIEQAIKLGVKGIGTLVYGGDPSSPSYKFGVKQLGNVEPGDGFKYRGRGFIQLTGRSNYARAGALDNPGKLLELGPAAETAVNFANRYKSDYANVKAFTQYVNGGQTHVIERGEFFKKFLNDTSITKANATSGSDVGSASSNVAALKKVNERPTQTVIVTQKSNQNVSVLAQRPRTERAQSVGQG